MRACRIEYARNRLAGVASHALSTLFLQDGSPVAAELAAFSEGHQDLDHLPSLRRWATKFAGIMVVERAGERPHAVISQATGITTRVTEPWVSLCLCGPEMRSRCRSSVDYFSIWHSM